MASWNEAYALCPFYDTDESNIISCEAILPKGKKAKHSFSSKAAKQKYLLDFCDKEYKKCPYYKALESTKYMPAE
ncbi:MAG: hypothetical protein ACI4GX_01420 [Ruminococcus sp.]